MMMQKLRRWLRREEGAALLEMAVTLPLLLFLSVAIFEFGRAYQAWQVLTNAAREGARVAVLPGVSDAAVQDRVQTYMTAGQLPPSGNTQIIINRSTTVSIGAGVTAPASLVQIQYPFTFVVMQPIANLLAKNSGVGTALTIKTSATMRNE
jgi:Flp pilus assembly protein TadG